MQQVQAHDYIVYGHILEVAHSCRNAFLATKSLQKRDRKIPLKFTPSAEGPTSLLCLMGFERALLQMLALNVHCGQMSCRLLLQ